MKAIATDRFMSEPLGEMAESRAVIGNYKINLDILCYRARKCSKNDGEIARGHRHEAI